jgi:hypothetical protein
LGKAAKHTSEREADETQNSRRIALVCRGATALLIALNIGCQSAAYAESSGTAYGAKSGTSTEAVNTSASREFGTPSLEEVCGKSTQTSLPELVALADGSLRRSTNVVDDTKTVPTKLAAAAPETNDPIELLTRKILQKQLELQKLNTQFRIETAMTSRWRQRRVFLYGETSATCTETSLIASISARQQLLRSLKAARGLPKGSKVPVETDDTPDSSGSTTPTVSAPRTAGRVHGRLAAANELQLTGQTVAATGDLFELGLNFAHYCQTRHRNFAPGQYRQRVHVIAHELESLILQRQQAIAQRNQQEHASRGERALPTQPVDQRTQLAFQPNADRDALETCEGKMLSDLRDLAMVDYLEYHAATERFWVLQNTAFLLDFAKNGVGMTGNMVSVYGSHGRRPRFAGTAGVCSVVTGAIVMLQPVVGRVSGNLSGSAARRLVSKELFDVNVRTSDIFETDRKRLVALQEKANRAGIASSGLAQRMPLYTEQEKLMREMNGYFKNERKRAHNTLVENVTFASIVGPTRVSNGVNGVVGGYRYYRDSPGRERMFLAGNISYACGTGLNMLETARVQANEELRQYRQGKLHMRTKQRFQARLQALDRLETTVK